jgi:hypothetical protein
MDLVEQFRHQAAACAEMGSVMYAELLDRLAADLEGGGVVRDVLAGHEHDPGPSALALRLAGSVHRLVLQGRAGELASYYPSVGGSWEPDGGWRAFETLLRERPDAVREWLDRPPQTNEVGRSAALMGGLLRLGERHRLPVRLFEIGSSGGLNLCPDRYGYTDEMGRAFGDPTSRLVLHGAWRGAPLRAWPGLRITERAGSDLAPVDVGSAEGRLRLTAYVWPDQAERLERLRLALEVAAAHPVPVREQDARSFVDRLGLVAGTTTVLWHSVMWQYLAHPDRQAISAAIGELGSSATDDAPFAHLRAEPMRRAPGAEHEFLIALQVWPGGEHLVLGRTVGHGVPCTWERPTAYVGT